MEIVPLAIILYLSNMTAHRSPSTHLPFIISATPAKKVSAIPLEPATWIIFPYPAFCSPHRKRLGRVYAKKIQLRIVSLCTQLGITKPIAGKLIAAIRHVFPAKYSKFKHFCRCKLRPEFGVKIFPDGFSQIILISRLHQIVDDNFFLFHSVQQSV